MYTIHVFGSGCDYEMLYFSLVDNLDYFYNCRDKNWYSNGFVNLLREALGHLHWYEEKLSVLYDEANEFDFDSRVQGNGYRTFIIIFERCFTEFYKFNKRLYASRNSFFFRAAKYLKEADCLVKILNGLRPALEFLTKMLTNNSQKQLLVPDKIFTAEELIKECEGINQVAFYSRFEGFYYCLSMRRILQGVGVIMATFSDLYQTSGGPISRAALTITNGLKYIWNPELRAEQIVDVAQNSSVEFLKSFWQLGESQFMTNLPRWICPKLQVKEEIYIPEEPVTLINIQFGNCVVIPVPSSHIPSAPIRCLLLSTHYREGQNLSSRKTFSKIEERSSSLLFHCHGGGFISQSPESHEIYLRHWAKDLNVPIFSVDYSLSPEAPFPRALEEVLLAYAWVLKNADKLGWTGEQICFAGDSAGGNVLLGMALRIIELGIRQPDAIFCAYSPLVLDMVPSPSRLLCWIDPLLPLGFMLSCLDAYAGTLKNVEDEYDYESNRQCGRRSRKISSSLSQILDSSMNFIKNCEWVEVEANEPPVNESNIFCPADKNSGIINEKDYILNFIEEHGEFNCTDLSEEAKEHKDYSLFTVPHDIIFDLKSKCQSVVDASFNHLSKMFVTSPIYQKLVGPFLPSKGFFEQTRKKLSSPTSKLSIDDKIKNLKLVPRNPFMSPLLASNEALRHMPPVYFVSLNFDPCLDDTVTFAKRLKSLGRPVELDVLDGLPHGFLNFLPFSQEAHNGSDVCVRRLKEALKIYC